MFMRKSLLGCAKSRSYLERMRECMTAANTGPNIRLSTRPHAQLQPRSQSLPSSRPLSHFRGLEGKRPLEPGSESLLL